MKKRIVLNCLTLAVLTAGLARGQSREDASAALRSGFVEVGRREIARSRVPKANQSELPSPYQATLPLMKTSPDLLIEAIEKGIREGSQEERIGAMEVYAIAVRDHRIPLQPGLEQVLLDCLEHDNFESLPQASVTIGTIRLYDSKETILGYLDALPRVRNADIREGLLLSAASLLHLDVPIFQQTTPLEKERILADLESWLNRNRDRIRYNKNGQLYVAGGEAQEGRVGLTSGDRGRIRQDPVCVLKLIRVMMDGEEADGVLELNARCGEALLGVDGASLIRKAEGISGTEGPSLDFQAAMAAARGKYATMDAVQLAIAYVASYVPDPEARKLALETLDDFGVEDMGRVLKGEPKEVRKKAKELANDVPKSTDDD